MFRYYYIIAVLFIFIVTAIKSFANEVDANNGFHIISYLKAAQELERMSKKEAVNKLESAAILNEKSQVLIILCRMLFTPKYGEKLRDPGVGMTTLVIGMIPINRLDQSKDFLDPVFLVNNIPFYISISTIFSGIPEPVSDYVHYCDTNGDWGKRKFKIATKHEMQVALKKFLNDNQGISFSSSDLKFLRDQMKPGSDINFWPDNSKNK